MDHKIVCLNCGSDKFYISPNGDIICVMSYCRKGQDSDIYMFPMYDESNTLSIVCYECPLNHGDSMLYDTPSEALAHLRHHQSVGHKVLESAITRLQTSQPRGVMRLRNWSRGIDKRAAEREKDNG
jgi:hypothetical protein